MKRATIQDVADAAGVSRAAVSKVLRNAYGLSADMKARVEAAMAQLNYRPQMAARGLRGKTFTLGVVFPEFRNPFFADIMDGVWEGLQQTDYQPLLGIRPKANATEQQVIEALMDHKVDGFIMICPQLDQDFLKTVVKQIPTVMIGQHNFDEGYDTVNNDDEKGAFLAVKHLYDLGHRNIAYYGLEPIDVCLTNSTTWRQNGYLQAMETLGIADHSYVINTQLERWRRDEINTAHALLTKDNPPTAVFAWTDSIALSIAAAAQELGIRIPQDLSLIGYDNNPMGSLPQISLTTIDQSGLELGRKATAMLLDRINGRTTDEYYVLEPELVVRDTTAAPGKG